MGKRDRHPLEDLEDSDVLTEGKAKILYKKGKVFYNPVQEFNRDLSVLVISEFLKNHHRQEGAKIVECLSATGLRSIRYALEVPNVSKIVANDIDPVAVDLIRQNIALNNVGELITPNNADAKYTRFEFVA